MPWLPMYVNKDDASLLLTLLNEDTDIAYIISNGKKKWRVIETIENLEDGRYCIWHVSSGPLPLVGGFRKDTYVKNPWSGWKEKKTGADPTQPYFGSGHPSIIWLNLFTHSTREPNKIGLSSFEWIGNHYKSIGRPAPDITKKWWRILRKSIAKVSIKLSRVDDQKLKNEIYTFPNAAEEIKNGKERAENPDVIDYS